MKTNKKIFILLILSIVFLILSFIKSWYSDELFNSLWILALIPSIVLFIIFNILIILNIITFIKNKSYISIISIIILGSSVLLFIFFPFREIKVNYELDKYEEKRMEIIKKIEKNELQADEYGNIDLPDGYKKISVSGQVHKYLCNEEGTVITFWVLIGIPDGSVEVIYSTGGEELIRDNVMYIYKIKKLRDNWYYVITD